MINEYDKLNKLLNNKRVLYIPIYSCFDYNTKLLNFKSDGNINRFLTTFSHCNNFKYLNILYPPKGNNIEWFEESCKRISNQINLLPCEHIVKSAKIERSLEFADKVYNELKCLYEYDYIIVESQHLFLKFYNHGYKNLIYWCPVCATNDKTRDFLEPFKELDRYIFSIAENIIVASKDQVEYIQSLRKENQLRFTNTILIETLIDRNINIFDYEINKDIINNITPMIENGWKIVYLPFRLTDKGYKFNEILEFLTFANNQKVIVLYSNPNNCNIKSLSSKNDELDYIDKHFIKVSINRDVYYTILDYIDCVIPYFEDTDFINHAAVSEFVTSKKCKVVKNLEGLQNYLYLLT